MDRTDPRQMAPLEHALDEVRDSIVHQPHALDSDRLVAMCEQLVSGLRERHAEGKTVLARTTARALAAAATAYLVRTDTRTAEDFASPEFVEGLIKRRGLDWLLQGKEKK